MREKRDGRPYASRRIAAIITRTYVATVANERA